MLPPALQHIIVVSSQFQTFLGRSVKPSFSSEVSVMTSSGLLLSE